MTFVEIRMKNRGLQYLGLLLLVLMSLAVIFLPLGARPEERAFTVSVTAPRPLAQMIKPGETATDKADDALAAEFKETETLPGSPRLASDGRTLEIEARARTRDEARQLADRIVRAISKPFPGARLATATNQAIAALPAEPLLPLGGVTVNRPLERDGRIVPAVKLGLDLQGGVNLVLQLRRAAFFYRVENAPATPEAREQLLDKVRAALRASEETSLSNSDVAFATAGGEEAPTQIEIRTQARDRAQFASQRSAIEAALKTVADTQFVPAREPQFYVRDEENISQSQLLAQTTEIIRSRVDRLGVSEPQIQASGEDRVIVQLPGVNDPERAVEVVGQTAQMQIVLLPSDLQPSEAEGGKTVFFNAQGQRIPNSEVLSRSLIETTQTLQRLGVVGAGAPPQPIVSGDDVKPNSSAGFAGVQEPAVFFELQGDGSRRFAAVTREVAGKGRFIPIFLDQEVISAPTVESPITGGSGQISGGFASINESQDLALLLNSGALPAPIDVIENRTVSATLGQDALSKALRAGLIGLGAVAVFMVVFYRLPGMLANFALAIYCLLNLAAFNLVGGTLTLPGIAGFLLALAMSLDTNILVFERLKEEMAIQPTFAAALRAAFARAWTAILDSHVTTLLAALVLFYFGTGPVKGFALTLGIGVLISLFSAISVTRLFLWSAAGLGEKNRALFAGKLPEREDVLAQRA